MRNSVPALNATHGSVVNDEVDRRVAAALRAQASGMGGPVPELIPPGRHEERRHRNGVPAWAVLALAVLLGAIAGGVAGVVSTW